MKRIFILSLLSSSLFAADPVEADFYKITTFDTPKETALEVGSIDLMPDGKLVGVSQICGYTVNDRALISLASIDEEFAELGTELVLTWGELNGGSRKPHVERHEQTSIRVTVSPAPFAEVTREKLKATL